MSPTDHTARTMCTDFRMDSAMNRRWILALLLLAGCSSGPPSVAPISYSSRTAADAVAEFDANKDGKLDAGELKVCPALAGSLKEIDGNGDDMIDGDELRARVELYGSGGVSIRNVPVRIFRQGKGVANVTVTLEPEKFMGGAIKPASGVTNATGDVNPAAADEAFPGVQVGCYKVVLSQKDAKGAETLPARFNTETTLGVEVAPTNRIHLVIELSK